MLFTLRKTGWYEGTVRGFLVKLLASEVEDRFGSQPQELRVYLPDEYDYNNTVWLSAGERTEPVYEEDLLGVSHGLAAIVDSL